MQAKIEIAFRRKVRAVWLDHGLALAAQNVPWIEAKSTLASEVAADNSGAETIRKALEHVRRIWFDTPQPARALRADALKHFHADHSPATRRLLNWGMAIAAYPFVGSVAEACGRLLKLQHEANRADIQRRLREQHGDRDFVNRITRYDVSSFLDWGVIVESRKTGVYLPGKRDKPGNGEQLAWLAEAVLISRNRTQISIVELGNHPALFPIALDTFNASMLKGNPRIRVERQGLNQEFVLLETAQPAKSHSHG